MATISKSVIQAAKELMHDNFTTEELKKALQLIYNAGYRKGLKAREGVPEYQD